MNNAAANRPTGVVVPQSQLSSGRGAPRTVSGFSEVKTYGIEYTDDDGNRHVTLAQYINGTWYLAPNGENYAATLRPLNKEAWLTKLLDERRAGENVSSIPKEDAVDVVGG